MMASMGSGGMGTPMGFPPRSPHGAMNPLEQVSRSRALQQDEEINQLCDLYQQLLTELNACHSLLQVDQERLAAMLVPYVNAQNQLVEPEPDVLLFKQGLDLRLQEFEEDCQKIQKVERRLQKKIDEACSEYDAAVHDIAQVADSRILRRLRDNQRKIDLQQQEIDQLRFEKDILEKETRKLREMAGQGHYTGPISEPYGGRGHDQPPMPRLHNVMEGHSKAPPIVGDQRVRHGRH